MPTHTRRAALAPWLAMALVALAVVPAMPAGAFHDETNELLATFVNEGDVAYTLRIDLFQHGSDCAGEDLCSKFVLDLTGYGPATAPYVSEGFFGFTRDKKLDGGFATIITSSPDREILMLPSLVEFASDANANSGAALPVVTRTVHEANGDDVLWRVGYGVWTKPGTYYVKVWMAGFTNWTLEVRSDDAKIAGVARGTSYVFGDERLTEGDLNVQAQRSIGDVTVGVKAMRNAYVDIEAESSLVGFWGRSIGSIYCQFTVWVCLFNSDVPNTVSPQISYDSPSGTHNGNPYWYTLDDGAGDYRFRVDRKLNVWGPVVQVGAPANVAAYPGEDMSYMTAADVAFP